MRNLEMDESVGRMGPIDVVELLWLLDEGEERVEAAKCEG